MLGDLTISNGIGWSTDGLTMYLVDSGPRVIHAFAFDPDRGTISDGRILVTVPEDVGAPDGMTVDAAGDLWVAIYGGGRVNRYAPDGTLARPTPSRPGMHMLRVRRTRPEPALRHDRDRGLDRRATPRRPRRRARVPVDTDATGLRPPVSPRPRLVA